MTRTELINQALVILSVIGSGQSAEADDTATVDVLVDPLFEQLADDEICVVANDDDIPAAWFYPLAELLANMAASSFSQQYSLDKKRLFESELIRLTGGRPTYETTRMDYF